MVTEEAIHLCGIYNNSKLNLPNLKKLGLYNIQGIDIPEKEGNVIGNFGKAMEKCKGKNSPVGHWEICGYVKEEAFKTYPNAFPKELVSEFISKTGIGRCTLQ